MPEGSESASESQAQKKDAECYCMLLRDASNALTSVYDDALRETGLTVRQFSVMCAIARMGCCSATELARATYLERSSLARLLRPLLAQRLVQDTKGKGARDSKLSLTEVGMRAVGQGVPLWRGAQAAVESVLSEDEVEQLSTLAARVRDRFGRGGDGSAR